MGKWMQERKPQQVTIMKVTIKPHFLFLRWTLHFYGQLKSISSREPWAHSSSVGNDGCFLLCSTLSLTIPKPEVADLGLRFLIFKGLVPATVESHGGGCAGGGRLTP